jgi:hypothetical protein
MLFFAYFFEVEAWLLGFQRFDWFYYIARGKFKQWFLAIKKDRKCQKKFTMASAFVCVI